MKTTNILIVICLSIITNAGAQTTTVTTTDKPHFPIFEFGFRYMPTVSAFSIESKSGGVIKGEGTFGYGIGGVMAINFTKHYGFQGEIMYNALSQKYKDEELNRLIKVRYVNIPLLFSMNTGKGNPVNLNLVVGPQFGYNLGSSISRADGVETDTITYVIANKRSDIGFAYGAGMEFMLNEKRTIRMDIGYRGVYGLTNITKKVPSTTDENAYYISSAKVRTHAIYLGIAFVF